MQEFTVLLSEIDSPENVITCHLIASDAESAYEAAAQDVFIQNTIGMEEDLEDPAEFDLSDFSAVAVFSGTLKNLLF